MSAQCAPPRRLPFIVPPDVEKFDFEPTRSKLLRILHGVTIAERVVSHVGATLLTQFSIFFEDIRAVSRYSRGIRRPLPVLRKNILENTGYRG